MKDSVLSSCDVAVIGAGPAGAATALRLAQHAPQLRVTMIDGSVESRRRVGESLSPIARPLLVELGVEDLLGPPHAVKAYGTAASWGADRLRTNEFLMTTHGPGWQLDRAGFDAALRERARDAGAEFRALRLTRWERAGDGWRLLLADGRGLRARFLVDATGGGAALAQRCGAEVVLTDPLVGVAAYSECDGGLGDVRTVVEATRDGWWYGAGLPGGGTVVAFMTDPTTVVQKRLHRVEHLRAALRECRYIGEIFGERVGDAEVAVRPTGPKCLATAAGSNWLAVGDAASTYDPLASQGVAKAIQSGMFAAYAISDALCRDDEAGLNRYRRFVGAGFAQHRRVRQQFYALEDRWPNAPFWERRCGSAN